MASVQGLKQIKKFSRLANNLVFDVSLLEGTETSKNLMFGWHAG